MKIGLVCPYSMARGGGVQSIVLALRTELQSRGHVVKIIAPQPRDKIEIDTEGILFLGGGTDYHSPLHTTVHVSASVDTEAIEHLLETEKFDILHFHEPWVPMLSRQVLSRSTSVNVATFHAKIPETLMARTVVKVVTPYTKSVLKYLDELNAVSPAAAEYVQSLTDQPVSIIPNAIDLTQYKKIKSVKTESDEKTIFFVGRLEGRKGVKYLIKAYAKLVARHPNTRLLIGGSGPDREKLEMLVDDLGLEKVTFLGFVSDEDKINFLQTADLFCSPAIYGESFGIVLLEALACGAVTVAGNNSGYESVMQGLGNISLVTPQDSKDFARRMELLLYDEKLRTLWKAWAAEYVQQFSYKHIGKLYEDFYMKAMANHAAREHELLEA